MKEYELKEFAEKILENWIEYSHNLINDEEYKKNYEKIIKEATKQK